MRKKRPSRAGLRGFPVLSTVVAGLLAGHWVTYRVAILSPVARNALLSETGHAYLPIAGEIALILALAAIGAIFVRQFGTAGTGGPIRFARLTRTLALTQVGLFVATEAVERMVAGVPVAGMLGHHLLPIGLVVQLLVAVGGAFLLRWIHRAAARLAAVLRHAPAVRPRRDTFVLPESPSRPSRILSGAAGVRGPPLLSLA